MDRRQLTDAERQTAANNARRWAREHEARAEDARVCGMWQRAAMNDRIAEDCRREAQEMESGRPVWVEDC